METAITYMKASPSEVINTGDIIMLDPATGYIMRAVQERRPEMSINTRLVVGICIWSDNDTPPTKVINGGKSKDVERITLDNNTSKEVETIIICGGSSEQNTREIIQVAYTGEQMVNLCGPARIGDRLCISNLPGKAQTKDFMSRTFENEDIRSIGKVIRLYKETKQAKVLLDIE